MGRRSPILSPLPLRAHVAVTRQGRASVCMVYGAWCVLACLYKYVGQEFVHPQRSQETMLGVAGTCGVCEHLQ